MLIGVLDCSDFAVIAVIVLLFAGGSAAYSRFKPSDAARLRRLEGKVNLILRHLGLEYQDPAISGGLSPEVKALADDPAKKIKAIALHREQSGVGLKEAKDAVEAYMAGPG